MNRKAKIELKVEGGNGEVARALTGLYSLDRALDGGFPLRSVAELYGFTGSGKSSLAYFLAGRVAAELDKHGIIVVGDFEGADIAFMRSAVSSAGLCGILRLVPSVDGKKKQERPDEDRLDDLVNSLSEEKVRATVLDSVGAIAPTAEVEGSVGDAVMGVRARQMAKYMRGTVRWLRNRSSPAIAVIVNHLHAIIGGRGSATVGGTTIQYLSQVRIRLGKDETFDDGSFVASGKVEKLKFKRIPSERGGSQSFKAFILPGYGVHVGLTAVVDCIDAGLAKKDRTITLKGKSFGFMSKLIEKYNDDDLFKPFVKALER